MNFPTHNLPRPAGILDTGYNENTNPKASNALMSGYTHQVVVDMVLHARGFYQTNNGEVYNATVASLIQFRPPSVITQGV